MQVLNMREELLKEIENGTPISYPMKGFVWGEGEVIAAQAELLKDIAKSLRIIIELQMEHLSEHGD
jgi:hypothetical protein